MSELNRGDNHVCLLIKCPVIGRSATLQRPSVRLGSGRRRGVEGRGTLSDSSQGLSVPLGLAGSRLRSGGIRGRVCSESTFSGLFAGGLFASAVAGVGG